MIHKPAMVYSLNQADDSKVSAFTKLPHRDIWAHQS